MECEKSAWTVAVHIYFFFFFVEFSPSASMNLSFIITAIYEFHSFMWRQFNGSAERPVCCTKEREGERESQREKENVSDWFRWLSIRIYFGQMLLNMPNILQHLQYNFAQVPPSPSPFRRGPHIHFCVVVTLIRFVAHFTLYFILCMKYVVMVIASIVDWTIGIELV